MWEDHEVDRRALAIEPGARVVVIAGAGDRALDAVAWGAGEVTAVDLNPAQLRLAALKVAAAGTLESPDLIAMFSVGRRPGVARLYRRRLRPFLTSDERAYWDRFIGIFGSGLHQHHPPGLAMWLTGWLLRLIGGRELRHAVAGAPDVATQARWYEQRLRGRYWNWLTRWLIGRSALMRWVVVHPGERELMREQDFQVWLEAGISRAVEVGLVRENPYWMGFLAGRPAAPEFEDAWLRPGAVAAVRRAPEVIELRESSIVEHLESQPDASVDAVGLSNVPDWLNAVELERLWAAVARTLVPGGRAVLRTTFLVAPLPSGSVGDSLVLDRELSAVLTGLERTGIYASVCVLERATGETRPAARPSGRDE